MGVYGAQRYLMRAWEHWSNRAVTAYFPSKPLLLFAFALQRNNNVESMLTQRCRRCPNIGLTLGRCLVFAGYGVSGLAFRQYIDPLKF